MKITFKDGSGTAVLKYVVEDTDRHGNVRVYFRRHGQKIRLHADPGTPAFQEEYELARSGKTAAPSQPSVKPHASAVKESLRWLVERYYESAEFKRLVRGHVRRKMLDDLCEKYGTLPFAEMAPLHVRKIRDARVEHPEAANARVKALRQVFAWAVEASYARANPAREVPYIRVPTEGFHTWSTEEVRQYEAKHAVGTKARLALDLMTMLGVRRSDLVRLGPPNERNGWIGFTETKGQSRKLKQREIPILPALRASIDATQCGSATYLVTNFSKPFTSNGFGNWFRKRCDEAGLPHCSAHGLRKAGATVAAENGASEHELMAIFGWDSPKQAALYTRTANRKKLVRGAIGLLDPKRRSGTSVPPDDIVVPGGTIFAKNRARSTAGIEGGAQGRI